MIDRSHRILKAAIIASCLLSFSSSCRSSGSDQDSFEPRSLASAGGYTDTYTNDCQQPFSRRQACSVAWELAVPEGCPAGKVRCVSQCFVAELMDGCREGTELTSQGCPEGRVRCREAAPR